MTPPDPPRKPIRATPIAPPPRGRPSKATDQDRAERPDRKRRASNRTVLLVLGVVGGIVVLGCGGLFGFGLLMKNVAPEAWEKAQQRAAEDRSAREKEAAKTAVVTRDEFTARVYARTRQQVLDAVGKPNRTQVLGHFEYWYYSSRTKDPATGNVDSQAQVCFESGIVRSVNY